MSEQNETLEQQLQKLRDAVGTFRREVMEDATLGPDERDGGQLLVGFVEGLVEVLDTMTKNTLLATESTARIEKALTEIRTQLDKNATI